MSYRFIKMNENGVITKQSFGNSFGLFGLSYCSYLSDRIYDIIDENDKGFADFNDFLKYMNILMNSTEDEKAAHSFKILDAAAKGSITYEDIEKIVYDISFVWNQMTGSNGILY